jgi:hypothetical protein
MQEVTFPAHTREGQRFLTPAGVVTVGKNRKTKITDEQHAALTAGYGDDFFASSDELTSAEERANAVADLAPQPLGDPNKDFEEYERAAAARDATKKAQRAAAFGINAAGENAAQKAELDENAQLQVGDGDTVIGAAESAALKRRNQLAAARAAKAAKRSERVGGAGNDPSDPTGSKAVNGGSSDPSA